ncbi:GT4 family glycosyltransferase PelF [Marinobacter daepoensis]|uniref:GT4 family glycosyltransferase PelF n=1 Tax=Marinobacter daepoensis TaxID=262077 RepID=UPI001C976F8C|nr:GT4 family glycosyltransferase PelF [Marinobacter daepoensis]MBY6031811.1 GT4 family glycosyltransferase PelF [Marinobacter daepoensis]
MSLFKRKQPYVADIALLLEGTYPFIRGGVSSWVHQMITGLPEYQFALIFLGGDPGHYGEQQYTLPENVTHLECHYLMESGARERPRPRDGNAEAFQNQRRLHDSFKANESIPEEVLTRVFRDLGKTGGITRKDFLYSRESWKVIEESFHTYCTEPSFVDYFWTIRTMHAPLFTLAEIAQNMPRVRMVHSISTGYAGLLGAMVSDRERLPYLISEHGIYTKERKIDLSQAQWIDDPDDQVSETLSDQLGYIRRLWIRFFEVIGRLAYQKANTIVSLYSGNRLRQHQDGAAEEKTCIIPNGIDPERFRVPREARQEAIPKVLGLVGRVVPIKDIKTFIRAMRSVSEQIPEAEGWIVGPEDEDPAYVTECRNLVASLGLEGRVKFLGFQNVSEILPQLGLMVLTSISEALPLVILEANAAGLPCLATDVGACRELIEGMSEEDRSLGPSGAVVPIADPEATAREAVRLLTDSQAWRMAQTAGLERVSRFYTLESMFTRYRALYQQALSSQGNEEN